ncbi:FAD-binding and (Fe-S)-binding domain-containing protein [Rosenbergiella nectarea]|uniref:D-2-hydroxyglutarate dehydrogenase YdiJ n=1 Tax=Rosenbergiella nectarea TaxID=988801 RepID=UPI001BDAF876|nr:FAD-binding and (Fe-S)-binding domain-containing protein [Rosenbergiella nectarea]MBT0729115.1 FAD-binding oxidoreductase [Rosenbergiella nectarea subsp. apis]
MIPQLNHSPGQTDLTRKFLQQLKHHGFTGDIGQRYADRLSMATDNSIYQNLPDAILFPKSLQDIVAVTQLAATETYRKITFTPRGGGTGTNGQSLTNGIVVDLSRHMRGILDFNAEEGWVRVEAGVVKDQLNSWLKPQGFFFAPELSTSNRATIGGMISTDASGQGSLVYGKTSTHVLGLRAVLLNGEVIDTAPLSRQQAEVTGQGTSQEAKIYREVMSSCLDNRALIEQKFPKLNRFLTGYDLRHVFSAQDESFDLTRILCGAEGSLAFIAEATLNVLPIPKVRQLVNIKYDSFDSALRNAPFLVEAKALSVETVDSTVLNLAREDIVWHSVSELITEVEGQVMQGINLVEFAGDDLEQIEHQVAELCQKLDQLRETQQAGVIGYQCCRELEQVEKIYAMRKKAVGLLGNAKGRAKPIPFVEDTAVPPEHLADYITEFRAILDNHNLSYGMFGHVDAGVLHVRPALDMTLPEHHQLMLTVSDQVAELTRSYGGLLWGEHGKGYRSAYSADFFGPELYEQLRRIKTVFDPDNRLNPGKICQPLDNDTPLLAIDSPTRGAFDRQIPVVVRESWRGAMDCNGNGLCFNFDVNSPMCPSMKVTRDRIHSPKGRATLVREWLRLLSEQNIDPDSLDSSTGFSLRSLSQKVKNSWGANKNEYDFSHEVKESMNGCLACKACATQCPIKIDVPAFRARFLELYHTRYLRPVADHIVANIEPLLPVMAKAPQAVNFLLAKPWVNQLSRRYVGMVDLPALSHPTLRRQLSGHSALTTTLEDLQGMSAEQRADYVVVVQDPFTSFYEANLVNDLVQLITVLGFKPVLLPFVPNGKPQQVKGFLKRFARTAKKSAEVLNSVAALEVPMVGTDPALVLCYRDEYKLLGSARGEFKVLLAHEWLKTVTLPTERSPEAQEHWYLFSHCTEVTALPSASVQWQELFAQFGATLHTINAGCCGMAGTYGHEARNLENSRNIFGLSWQPQLADKPIERCLATGFSCRSQVKRFGGDKIKHPLQALLHMARQRS